MPDSARDQGLESAHALADRLLETFETLSPDQQHRLRQRLSPMLPAQASLDREAVVADVAAVLKLSADSIEPERVGELCAILLRLAQFMDPVWQIWDDLAPLVMRAPTTPTITEAAPAYLQQPTVTPREKEAMAIEGRRLGRIVAQLLLQVKPASKRFADDLAKELSPRRIEDEAEKKKTTFGGSDPWGTYKAKPSLYDKEELCERMLESLRELVQRSIR
jgi:hypothetical protein